ncbi:MAG: MarR family winged helix-turn-helix transcriptional regulator [Acidimicrobiales bacterium]
MSADPVDQLVDSWRAEVPDLDTSAMATIARLNRSRALAMQAVEAALTEAGSSLADFDVLAALRRQGAPYRLTPSRIAESLMLSASGTTSRVDRLERAGLVERVADPDNRRTMPVQLTATGFAEAERLVRLVVETEAHVMGALSVDERAHLDRLLAALAAGQA